MTAPSTEAVDAVRAARTTALVGLAAPPHAPDAGLAALGVLVASGPDAPSFLHSQLTNEVEGLAPGMGNLTARVTRTGHVEAVASLHRTLEADPPTFWLVGEAQLAQELHDGLDAFLFSDVLTLTVQAAKPWLILQGPKAAEVADALFGPLGFEPWETLPEHAIRPLRRARGGLEVPDGAVAIRRSLTGDVGFLVAWPDHGPTWQAVAEAARRVAEEHAAVVLEDEPLAEVIEIGRIEAGLARIGPETSPKRRLLPETGLEQQAVSYTKGCYLGQEVIARVRTYGSVPHLLRALVLPADAALSTFPAHGEPLVSADDGKTVGAIASRTWSPEAGGPVALAYLGRNHRTPGATLHLEGPEGPFHATVALLPLYSAPDTAARVQHLYDRAIRAFADNQAPKALAMLEEALRLDPGFADAYEVIGVMLGKAGQYHEAIDFFRRLEEVAPDEPLVNTNLSLYYMKIGDKDTAEDEAGKATLKSMNAARGKGGADVDADLIRAKQRDAARKLKMFDQVLDFDPVDPIALFGRGSALLTLERPAEAADTLAEAVIVDKTNSALYALHGKALEKLERTDEAVATYRAGIEVASRKGDLMPLKEMEHRLLLLGASRR